MATPLRFLHCELLDKLVHTLKRNGLIRRAASLLTLLFQHQLDDFVVYVAFRFLPSR